MNREFTANTSKGTFRIIEVPKEATSNDLWNVFHKEGTLYRKDTMTAYQAQKIVCENNGRYKNYFSQGGRTRQGIVFPFTDPLDSILTLAASKGIKFTTDFIIIEPHKA